MSLSVPVVVSGLSEDAQDLYRASVTLYLQDLAKRTLALVDLGYDPKQALSANITVDILMTDLANASDLV